MLVKGLGIHQGQDVPRYKEAGPPFPASVTSVPWGTAKGGGGGDHFALLDGKVGLWRLMDLGAEAGSDIEEPAVLGKFLHL